MKERLSLSVDVIVARSDHAPGPSVQERADLAVAARRRVGGPHLVLSMRRFRRYLANAPAGTDDDTDRVA